MFLPAQANCAWQCRRFAPGHQKSENKNKKHVLFFGGGGKNIPPPVLPPLPPFLPLCRMVSIHFCLGGCLRDNASFRGVGELSGGAGRRIACWTSDGLAPFSKGTTSPAPSLGMGQNSRTNQPTNQPYSNIKQYATVYNKIQQYTQYTAI